MGHLRSVAAVAALAGCATLGIAADPRLQQPYWGEPLELGALGKHYSHFQTFSPDGKRMLVQHHGELHCVDIAASRMAWSVESKGLFNAAYSPDGRTIATAQWENGANLFDAATGRLITTFVAAGGGGERPDQVGFLPDGNLVVHTYASSYRELKDQPMLPGGVPRIESSIRYSLIVWNPKTRKDVNRIAREVIYGNANKWQWLKGGSQMMQTLTTVSENGVTAKQTLSHVDPRTGKQFPEIDIRKTDERCFDMSPDGKHVLLGSAGEAPRVIETATGDLVRKLDGHRGFVTAGAYSPDGKLIATVSGTAAPRASYVSPPDGPCELIIRDAATGAVAARFEYQPSTYDFTKVWFSPDGQVVIAETKQHKLVAWGRFAFERPAAGQRAGLPPMPEPPAPTQLAPGGFPHDLETLLPPVPDTLAKLVESLPKSGRSVPQQIDLLYVATLGRLPTPEESKRLAARIGEKPTVAKWKEELTALTITPEFLTHANSLIQRINGKNRRLLNPLQPSFGDP